MVRMQKILGVFLSLVFMLPAMMFTRTAEDKTMDYGDRANWAYFAMGEDKAVDVFIICPTVDTQSETNAVDFNDQLKAKFVKALDMEKGIYEETGRLFSPYYRQMSLKAYTLGEKERAKAREVAYGDISDAFRWYLDNENHGRGLILAGFSQGADMCLELLKEYYGGDGADACALRDNLIGVYAIGWSVTEEMTIAYPQIIPAKGEADTGVVISFDCEDGTLTDTVVIPAGAHALSINPLNWKTDGTIADKSQNVGAVMPTNAEPKVALCGAYIGKRGELVVTDINPKDYPPVLDLFPQGSYHIYDYMFFFTNLKNNVAARTNAWRTGMPYTDVTDEMWYKNAVFYAYKNNLMTGTAPCIFEPDTTLSRAQLITILWRMAGEPLSKAVLPFDDVKEDMWYTEAIRWALQEKISIFNGNRFEPDAALTRDETAALLWNSARYMGAEVGEAETIDMARYSDAFAIDTAYVPAMQWALRFGIIQGTDGGALMPKGQLTRAQAAAMLQRFFERIKTQEPLSLWEESAKARKELVSYINDVTDEASKNFIPVKDRIAVFDLDGTLFCETDPNYFDYTLLKYRVLEDADYKDKASDFEREVAKKIQEQNETGKSFAGLEVDHGKAVASAFRGMTVAEFNAYIQAFKKQPMPSYVGMNRGEGFYQPMVQVVNYLQEHDFTVYIVSGTDRLIVRGLLDNNCLNIPNRQIIGSDETIVSSNQGDTDGLNYVFIQGDELILGGEFLIKNLKMNKVSVIMQEIGQQPVLSFGNSTGDSSMAEYVTSNNRYKSLAFMLCCDDTERENGSKSKADKMFALCEEFDWVPISMKNDWVTIYGEGVTYVSEKVQEKNAA